MADANNIEIQQQLNKLLTEQKRILRDNTRSLREQVELTNQMAESLNKANIGNDLIQKSNSLKNSLMGAADEASKFTKNNREMAAVTSDALRETDDGFEGLLSTYGKATAKASVWGAATGGFIEGVQKGFNLLTTGLSGILSLAGSVVEGMFSIGKAIISIPFKIFNAFVNEANRMRGEPLLAREFEETRKSFGDFGEDLSKHVIGGYRKLRGELAETGLSVYRVLGYRHEQLKFVREQFEALGPLAHNFGNEIAMQAEHFAAYQKGLGLSGEMMKGLGQATQGTEDSFEETLRTTTNFTTNLGKRFGISQKVIGRDIGEMSKDLKTFGSVGVRQMGQLSVFARKLGADFKDLLGVVNKFDNFEDAAESAARLAQAFGLNIDAMEMINEQDPAARIEMLRKAFFQTGKDITNLSRQERNYLAATAGIEDQALNSVFALQNQGKTYDEISSAGQTAEQQQITQAEAMQKLSDSIERMIKSGHRVGGFFDRFIMGFKRGMRWSKPFRDVMINIRKSLWAAERAGRAVGRAFVQYFPGVKKFLEGMKDFFDPKKFRRLGGKVVSAFKQFFKDLGNPKTAEKALGNLLSALKKAFFGMGESQRGAMSKIIEGFKAGFKAVGQIILSGIKIALQYMVKFFKAMSSFIRGDRTFFQAMKDVFSDGASAGSSFLDDVWFQISKQLGPVTEELGYAFEEMLSAAWAKFTGWFESIDWWEVFKKVISSKAGQALALVMFGPALLKFGISLLGSTLSSIMSSQAVAGAAGKMVPVFGRLFAAAGPIAAVVASMMAGWEFGKWIDKSLTDDFGRSLSDRMAGLQGSIGRPERAGPAFLGDLKKEEQALLKQRKVNKEMWKNAYDSVSDWDSFAEVKRKKYAELMKVEDDAINKINQQGRKRRDAANALQDSLKGINDAVAKGFENSKKPEEKMGAFEIESMLDGAKKFSPKQIKKAEKTLKDAKDLIIKPGGLKSSMDNIVKAFEGFDQTGFNKASETINSLFIIPNALSEISRTKMSGKEITKSLDNAKMGISSLAKMAIDMGPTIDEAGPGAEKMVKNLETLAAIPETISGFSEGKINSKSIQSFSEGFSAFNEVVSSGKLLFSSNALDNITSMGTQATLANQGFEHIASMVSGLNDLVDEMSEFTKGGKVKNLPVVRGIMNLVEASNNINNELAGLTSVNLKPKIENLGKVLGLKGSDSIKIEHQNFNVDINVTVELDPTKLTDAIVDTGRVVRTPKMPRR